MSGYQQTGADTVLHFSASHPSIAQKMNWKVNAPEDVERT